MLRLNVVLRYPEQKRAKRDFSCFIHMLVSALVESKFGQENLREPQRLCRGPTPTLKATLNMATLNFSGPRACPFVLAEGWQRQKTLTEPLCPISYMKIGHFLTGMLFLPSLIGEQCSKSYSALHSRGLIAFAKQLVWKFAHPWLNSTNREIVLGPSNSQAASRIASPNQLL